ncbi:MAG: diaminopimelate decarboxylase [Actinobacteria bacterium]|nr:diaminopimelate decarboxylase [Actinomycetota bacterium]
MKVNRDGELLYPLTAEIDDAGELLIGGKSVVELARRYGTPLYIVDKKTIVSRCKEYIDEFSARFEEFTVAFAIKAFNCLAIAEMVCQNGLNVLVSTGGELYLALKAGFNPERILFHGNNKTADEIRLARNSDVGILIVDNFDELRLIDSLYGEGNRKAQILLRITPGISTSTHEYIMTGQIDVKFGFALWQGMAKNAVKLALNLGNVELKGFHSHIGSQLLSTEVYRKSVEVMVGFAGEIREETGYIPEILDFGGGLGIKYLREDRQLSVASLADAISGSFNASLKKYGLDVPKIYVEPGRSIVGNSTITAYTVGSIKELPGVRNYVSVDGGMSDNLRVMLYGARYEALLASRADAPAQTIFAVAGKHCEQGDVIVKEVRLPEPKIGDILVTPSTGAYGYSMSNNYNMQPRPAAVLVEDGRDYLIIRREEYPDLIRDHVSIKELKAGDKN